jgi:anaerobic magnesium-protoporphyrin IX monomethyl ester cyclase
MRKIDILFVHPNASAKIYQGLASKHSAIEPPIWAGMLANSVRAIGYNSLILDAEAERINFKETVKKIIEINPRIVCFVVYGQQPSASSQNMEGATDTAKHLKEEKPDSFILFVGGHVSALPRETLENEKSIDAVCQNEGVYTIRNILKLDKFNDENLKNVKGLAFRNSENNIEINNPSEIVSNENLEIDLPGVAWDLLPGFEKYRTAGWHSWSNNSIKEPFASLYTTLGCPYRCSFCMINIINRTNSAPNISSADSNIYRKWSPDFIIRQFEYFAQNNVKNIKIADELFVLNPNHFGKICEMIIERKYDFNIWAYSRVDTCKPAYLDLLMRAGVKWLGLGIENPDEIVRKEIHKDGFKDVKILDLMSTIRSAGINIGGNYIFGLPNDTRQSMENTLKFALENKSEMVNFYSAMAYPGSPLYINAKINNKILPKKYSAFSQHSYDTCNLSNEALTSAEILKFRDYAWNKYNTDESYLNLLENKFGINARLDLEQTTKVQLKREILGDSL